MTVFLAGLLALLFGAARAEAVPSVTFECTPGPADCSGWHRSNVSIDWTVLPSTATVLGGCQDRTLSDDTLGSTEFCSARDGSTVTIEVPIQVDKTPPAVLSGQPGRGADVNGWYNHPVGVTFSGSDRTSGIDFCTARTYSGPDSSAASLFGTCTDNAGNESSPLGYGLKYDQSGPVLASANPERQPNAAGWFKDPVRFNLQASDETSGIADCPSVTYNGPDSATASFTGTCRDQAGNLANRSFGLKYDSTDPTGVSGRARRVPDKNGWYNAPVPIDFTGTDQVSGIAACTTTTYNGADGNGVSVPGTCTDKAGNESGPSTFGFQYDDTRPVVIGGDPARGADVNGWYNDPVRVTFNGSDQMSGIDACTAPTYASPDSRTASLSGTCTDRAGNLSNPFPYGLQYDATDPAVSAANPERAPNAAGWFNDPVRFNLQASDATSGIASCPSVNYSGPDSATASFTASCRDVAGNTATPSFGLKYDETDPKATGATPERPANAAGWYNAPVSVAFGGTDGTSGVAACTSKRYEGPDDGDATVAGTCTDRAGNLSAPLDFALSYDSTKPTVDSGHARQADGNGWYNSPVTIVFDGTDNLSGLEGCTSATYSGPDTPGTSVGGTCKDKAGNVGTSLGFGLKYDSTAPSIDKGQPGRLDDANGWYNEPVEIRFSGSDGLSGMDSCDSPTYSGPDSATASVVGKCRDQAGNESGSTSSAFKYDATAPTVTEAHPDRPPEPNGWYIGPVTFDIEGDDATSKPAVCPSVPYSQPDSANAFVIGECHDQAGNVGRRAFGLMYDDTAPPITDLTATPGDRSVALSWRTTEDTESVAVMRTPGLGLAQTTSVFSGPGTSFVDGQVDNGVEYAYEVQLKDPAGNVRAATVRAVPSAPPAKPGGGGVVASGSGVAPTSSPASGPTGGRSGVHLIAPAAGAIIRPGQRPLLRWTPVLGAEYYNLQLFRRGKILTVWPSEPRYRLKLRWRYRGKRYRLGAGEYHWIVWPGFGPRSKADYGRRIGRRGFEVRARAR